MEGGVLVKPSSQCLGRLGSRGSINPMIDLMHKILP